jgi:hypothetical protein
MSTYVYVKKIEIQFPSLTRLPLMSDHQKCRKRIRRRKHEKKEEARPALGKAVTVSESQRKNLTISSHRAVSSKSPICVGEYVDREEGYNK